MLSSVYLKFEVLDLVFYIPLSYWSLKTLKALQLMTVCCISSLLHHAVNRKSIHTSH